MDSSRLFNVGSSFIGFYLVVMLLIFNRLGIWFDLDINKLGSIIAVIGLMIVLSNELVNQILIWIFIKFWGGYESLGIQGEIEKEYKLNREKIASTYNRLTRMSSRGMTSDTLDTKFDINASLDFVRRHQQALMTRRFIQSCIILLGVLNFVPLSMQYRDFRVIYSIIIAQIVLGGIYAVIQWLYKKSNSELLEFEKHWIPDPRQHFLQ